MRVVGEGAGGWDPDPLALSVCKKLPSGGLLSWAPSSGQSSQGFADGVPSGVTLLSVSRVGRLSLLGNSTVPQQSKQGLRPSMHTHGPRHTHT